MSVTRSVTMITEIREADAAELDIYARESENKLRHYYEPRGGLFIAESPKVIRRALDAGYEPVSFLLEKKHITGEMKEILESCGEVQVFTAELPVLESITGYKLTGGALCAMKRKELPKAESLLVRCGEEYSRIDENSTPKSRSRVAVIANVENPTNVGAIIRSAAAMGMDAVFLTRDCSDPLFRRAIRVSMGTVFQVPWTYIDSLGELKEAGYRLAAMALTDDSVRLDDEALGRENRLAIVVGNEGDGLSREMLDICDYAVKIPMHNQVDSLNAAAAAAVAFWELR
ncbi:MAG: RNA methyltransferase [Clostridiales bacterium]|nr:RNA methyltransferase [Clostridiales bacterium]